MKTRCKVVISTGIIAAITGGIYYARKVAQRLVLDNPSIDFSGVNFTALSSKIPFNITGTNNFKREIEVEKVIGDLFYKGADVGDVDLTQSATLVQASRFSIPVEVTISNLAAAAALGKDLVAGKKVERELEFRGYIYFDGGKRLRYTKRFSA